MPPTPEANYDSIEPTPVSDKSAAALTSANDSNRFSKNPQPISKERDAIPAVLQNTQPAEVIEPRTSGIRELRTSDQIARMILAKLHAIDRCPDRGFVVTVYGSNQWNAMLTITPLNQQGFGALGRTNAIEPSAAFGWSDNLD